MLKEHFDRKQYLEILEKRVNGLKHGYRQNLAITGDEFVGKTSLILRFLGKFHDANVVAVYVEIQPESLAGFAKRFIGTLLYNFLINSGIPLKEDVDFLISKSEKYIPKTIEKIRAILAGLSSKKKTNCFIDLLCLADLMHQESGKYCIIIFDEFHNLENIGIKNLYRDWSKLIMLQKTTMYILVSSLKYKTKLILSKNLSLLFGNFEHIPVEPFDTRTSEEYLEERLARCKIEPGLKNFIVHLTGGSPMYLEIITSALIKSPNNNLAETLENLLFESSGTLNQIFLNYIKRFLDTPHNQDYIPVLYLISCGNNKLQDIAHILRKTKKDLAITINKLIENDVITRCGDFFKISDRTLSFWIKFVYQEKMNSLRFDNNGQKTVFRTKIEAMIHEFLADARKPLIDRMAELLRMFEDDMIQIEKKKLKLSHFREIKSLDFGHRNFKNGILGRSSDSLWIMAFKPEQLNEEDITEFAKECKKYRHKLQRKIIVTFSDIEANARLRAMEEKILTWNLDHLNHIFDLFSKPRVIV